MAWGKKAQPPPPSALRQIIPLIITLLFLAGVAWVLWQVYLSVNKIQESASERMGKKNVVFTKDGVRVGVKHTSNENYVDKTQSWVVKAWNLSGNTVGQIKKTK
ncbi:hypothetical protein HER10_EVM0001343 [Colletotrichum scovillei]|uniref:Uncharacterized protein n=4 Tax=Colletotrichum acutatum species complex TaxID=2707335 RepID=A0A010RYC4_9PEZI|nr:uncharacterized protein HER10_EVM0001343 [Colletotrichum scovillei]XP_053045589.1 uncharacterized protein COL516b_010076 [Colletotrichum fioriniae]EXF85616.1 hypothetical protein CFIO01_08070 [Colletotrichum fioriniae PJ7]KXH45310.1 hypothetical protein CNYM01_12301 [Colletotrichum nymphaeae SA-01]KXH50085.1 hypothetical protein CSIM01_07343 [Colletotrichum simmondsii]KAF4774593.1 hypothetical protein HER10_EVM0001343 [Colletotrichum scovillei]KAG7042872.1 hypothetical protein JMJ78_000637